MREREVKERSPKELLLCCIRKKNCIATPEEHVRQALLRILCEQKGFPASLCSVELSLDTLLRGCISHSRDRPSCSVARRRIDILFFKKTSSHMELRPFFLIECKASSSSSSFYTSAKRQVIGYKTVLGSLDFIAIASSSEIIIWSSRLNLSSPLYRGSLDDIPLWETLE